MIRKTRPTRRNRGRPPKTQRQTWNYRAFQTGVSLLQRSIKMEQAHLHYQHRKMVNVNAQIPFKLHNQSFSPAFEPSLRSASASTDHNPNTNTPHRPGPGLIHPALATTSAHPTPPSPSPSLQPSPSRSRSISPSRYGNE